MSETTDKKPFWERIKPKADAATSSELLRTLDTVKEKKEQINKNKKNKYSKLNQTFDAQPE